MASWIVLTTWTATTASGAGAVEALELQEPSTASTGGALWISLELSELSSASGGGRAAVDWMPATQPRFSYLVGLSSSRLADSEWTVGRSTIWSKVNDRLSLRGGLHLGFGRRDGQGFGYRIAEAGATFRIAERLYFDVENRYLDIDTTHGNLVLTSLTYLPLRRLSSKLSYIRATGGNTESDFVAGRLDYFAGRLHVLGGLTVGRTRPEIVEILGGDAARLEQVFAGMAFPVARARLTVVLDYLTLDDAERVTLTLSLHLPATTGVTP